MDDGPGAGVRAQLRRRGAGGRPRHDAAGAPPARPQHARALRARGLRECAHSCLVTRTLTHIYLYSSFSSLHISRAYTSLYLRSLLKMMAAEVLSLISNLFFLFVNDMAEQLRC